MKTADIEIGEWYAAKGAALLWPRQKTILGDRDLAHRSGHRWRIKGAGEYRAPGGGIKVRVLATRVEYGKSGRKTGVEIEFDTFRHEECKCGFCGHTHRLDVVVQEQARAVINNTMIIGQWEGLIVDHFLDDIRSKEIIDGLTAGSVFAVVHYPSNLYDTISTKYVLHLPGCPTGAAGERASISPPGQLKQVARLASACVDCHGIADAK